MHNLADKTVLLTGASRGIGAATARALGAAGAFVIAHHRGGDEVREATASIPDERKLHIAAELADPAAVRELWRRAVAWRGRVDVLVNNAAVLVGSPLDASDEEWDDAWRTALAVNVLAAMQLLRAATIHFRERGGGVLITLSSWVAERGSTNPDLIAYSASKAAVKAATQTVARAHASAGVLAYIVAPGVVRTQMSDVSAASAGGEDAVSAGLAMGEWVPPEEIADLVTYLAGGSCRHLTGATLDVNGASYMR